jgi:hypothetical protein
MGARLIKAPDGLRVLALNVLWLQEKGAQVRMPIRGQGLLLRSTLPAQWAICQPHQMEMPTQGVIYIYIFIYTACSITMW